MRIVSLLPSATEICYAVGLENQLVGVTHECDYPERATKKLHVTKSRAHNGLSSSEIDTLVRSQLDETGSLYELNFDMLSALEPDLILTQRLCTVCAVSIDQVREMAERLPKKPHVENLEPRTLDEVLETIRRVAVLGDSAHHGPVLRDLRTRIEHVKRAVKRLSKPKVLVLEWVDPPFASGHWIPELVEIAGGENTVAFKHAPSREVTWDQVVAARAEIIIIAECGFDVQRQKQDIKIFWEKIRAAEHGFDVMPEVWVCDGSQYFSRPGPRLVDTLELLAGIIHREVRSEFLGKYQLEKDFESIT
ncbi:MAG: cobalamin-binding protein [Bacteroidota bacterium]|nr:cobalamin-binding protein [Bacteroidota bacterium]MDP4232266.1 cobalamin-binding protein [Bacteroidota bacterium]MDP4242668.1 cobalamin-binding protein [Bacteroidota bacterium]